VRLATAILVIGAALVGALVLHGHRVNVTPCSKPGHVYFSTVPPRCGTRRTPGWVDPVALGICFLGLAGAAAILTARRSRS
jgi:hypothetical protein